MTSHDLPPQVRSHFETNAEAKRILQLIQGWMKEGKANRQTKLRRCEAQHGAPKDAKLAVVFAPLPNEKVREPTRTDKTSPPPLQLPPPLCPSSPKRLVGSPPALRSCSSLP